MSCRLFLYYCVLVGGWAGLVSWLAGELLVPTSNPIFSDAMQGLLLGFCVGLGLGCVDAVWNTSPSELGKIGQRLGVAFGVGALGGFLGGLIGRSLLEFFQGGVFEIFFFVFGWTLTGAMVGAAVGAFEFLEGLLQGDDLKGPRAKLEKTLFGGTAGGFLGGFVAYLLKLILPVFLSDEASNELLSPTAIGFVALGMSIGLLISLAQVIFRKAWVRVEVGFGVGREKILTREFTTIGRAECCDIGLFTDQKVEKFHAKIVEVGNQYFVEDEGTPNGTFVNNQKVAGRNLLRCGDKIRVGDSVLCFFEREKNGER